MSGAHLLARRSLLVGVIVLAGLSGACGSAPPVRFYSLSVPHTAVGSSRAESGAPRIGVRALEVEAPYDQVRIVYRSSPSAREVGFYHYHRWARSMSEEITRSVAAGLGSSIERAEVEVARKGRRYDALIAGRLTQMEEVAVGGGVEARVSISLRLESAEGSVLWSGTLSASAGGTVDSVEGLVGLFDSALKSALEEGAAGMSPSLRALP